MPADEEYGAIFNTDLHHKKTDLESELIIEESTSMINERESAVVVFIVLVAGFIMTYYLCG